MKKRISLLLALLLTLSTMLFALPSCGASASSPEDAAKKYVEATMSFDFATLASISVGNATESMLMDYMAGLLDKVKSDYSYGYTSSLEAYYGTTDSKSIIKKAISETKDALSLSSMLAEEGYTLSIETYTGSVYQGQQALNIINEYNEEASEFINDVLDGYEPAGALELARKLVCNVPESPQVTEVNVVFVVKDITGEIVETDSDSVCVLKNGSSYQIVGEGLFLIELARSVIDFVDASIDY